HRDVKPGNVLLGSGGNVKVADFGIAKAAVGVDDISTTGTLLGTVAYISPEQANGLEPDERSDIYSTGVLLYELVTGKPPFSGDNHVATALMHVKQQPRPPRSVRAGIPRALDEVVMTALAKDPDDRFTSAAEMRTALERSNGATPTSSRPAVAASPLPTGTSLLAESRWLVPVVALIVGVVAIAAILAAIFTENPIGNITGGWGPESGRLRIEDSTSFDPEGDDDDEHSERAGFAHDQDAATTWITQTYSASLQTLGKSGVGLLFDLGSEQSVARVEISSPLGGYDVEIRSAQSAPSSIDDTELVGELDDAGDAATIRFEPAVGRYWIVWITSLPGGGAGKAEIAEVSFFGS
ncbi:MAG: protein kinase, partial [Actinomycetota bacterium]|nr:protein kinase [Actinomycetota bacterium]